MQAGDWIALASILAVTVVSASSVWQAHQATAWTARYAAYQQERLLQRDERAKQRRLVEEALDAVRLPWFYSGKSVGSEYMSALSVEGLQEQDDMVNHAVRLLISAGHHPSPEIRVGLAQLRPALRAVERSWMVAQPDISTLEPMMELWEELGARTEASKHMEPLEARAHLNITGMEMVELAEEMRGPGERVLAMRRTFQEVDDLCERIEIGLNTWDVDRELAIKAAEPDRSRLLPIPPARRSTGIAGFRVPRRAPRP